MIWFRCAMAKCRGHPDHETGDVYRVPNREGLTLLTGLLAPWMWLSMELWCLRLAR